MPFSIIYFSVVIRHWLLSKDHLYLGMNSQSKNCLKQLEIYLFTLLLSLLQFYQAEVDNQKQQEPFDPTVE